MKARDLVSLVLSNLSRMKARVLMTVVGVVIGTGAVVVLVSLGAGLQKRATEGLFSLGGLDELIVREGIMYDKELAAGGGVVYESAGARGGQSAQPAAKLDDAMVGEIRQLEGVLAAVPFIEVPLPGPLRLDRQDGWAMIYGVDIEELAKIVDIDRGVLELYRGQVVAGSSVPEAFISWELREQSATTPPPPDLLGRTLRMISYTYEEGDYAPTEATIGQIQVVGLLRRHGFIIDYGVFMRMKEAQSLRQRLNSGQPQTPGSDKRYPWVLVKLDHPNKAPLVEQVLKDKGFMVESDRTMLEQVNRLFAIIQAVLGGIGAIALLVAAFGIANTMTMAIYERTREIGLMKAVGATNQDVMSVFLTEAGAIGFLGGVGGVLLALGLNVLVNAVAPQLFPADSGLFGGPQPGTATSLTFVPLWLPIFAITFATLVGVVSGIYPAIRAAALSPIRALKYE